MTSTATEHEFTVGMSLSRNARLIEELPVGAKIIGNTSQNIWEKIDPTTMRLDSATWVGQIGRIGQERACREFTGGYSLHSLPEARLPVGTVLFTEEQVIALPEGTRIANQDESVIFTRVENDRVDATSSIGGTGTRLNYNHPPSSFTGGAYHIHSYPEVEEPVFPAVGSVIGSREQLDSLPVGTVINQALTGGAFARAETKSEGNRWRREGNANGRDSQTFAFLRPEQPDYEPPYTYTVESLPQAEVTEERAYTREELSSLPVGTVVRSNNGRTWQRESYGMRMLTQRTDGQSQTWDVGLLWSDQAGPETNGGEYTIVNGAPAAEPEVSSVLNEPIEGVEITLPMETLVQYQQRFRTEIEGGAQADSINSDRVEAALTKVGVPDTSISAGMVVNQRDHALLENLPEGTTVTFGADFSDPAKFRSYQVADRYGTLRGILGDLNHSRMTGVVDHIPRRERQAWVDQVPMLQELHEVAAFQARVWELGDRVKQDMDLCRQYERAMAACGISQAVVDIPREHRHMSAGQVSALPAGSVLRYSTKWGTVLLIRDDRATNPARTIRLAGGIPGDWVMYGMTLVHHPDNEVKIMLESLAEMEELPEGTKIQGIFNDNPSTYTRRNSVNDTGYKWMLEGESNPYYGHEHVRLGSYAIIELGSVLNQEGN